MIGLLNRVCLIPDRLVLACGARRSAASGVEPGQPFLPHSSANTGHLPIPVFPLLPQPRTYSATRSFLYSSMPKVSPLSCLPYPSTLEKVDFSRLCCYTLCSPQQRHSIRHLFNHREVGGNATPQTTSKANESCRVMHGSTTMATTIEPLLRYEPPAYLPELPGATSSLFTCCSERDTDISCRGFPLSWRKGKVKQPFGCPEIWRLITRHLFSHPALCLG